MKRSARSPHIFGIETTASLETTRSTSDEHHPDLDLIKQVNRQFVSGVTVVAAMDRDKPMETEIRERLQASTHTLFVCRVQHATVGDHHPMVYSAGKFYDGAALPPLG